MRSLSSGASVTTEAGGVDEAGTVDDGEGSAGGVVAGAVAEDVAKAVSVGVGVAVAVTHAGSVGVAIQSTAQADEDGARESSSTAGRYASLARRPGRATMVMSNLPDGHPPPLAATEGGTFLPRRRRQRR